MDTLFHGGVPMMLSFIFGPIVAVVIAEGMSITDPSSIGLTMCLCIAAWYVAIYAALKSL